MTTLPSLDPELLAPAGTTEALRAAVLAGADAVYLGLGDFNARRGADNFTPETLSESCSFAHLHGVRVYLTLNTVVLPQEMSAALQTASAAVSAGVDAFIVQDLGLMSCLAREFPQVELHVSTQMNIHNADGIHAAAALGARRVTLARELSLAEISHLAQEAAACGMEVEVFAHGALCVCYSGQCLMSSLIGGRSANRGLCAQACRLPYELLEGPSKSVVPLSGEHLLSLRDLCSVDLLGELVDAGVSSLKIEGRMKSSDYVYAVTRTYRAVLDRVLDLRSSGRPGKEEVRANTEEMRVLAEAFSRGFTTAYLEGQRGNEIMSYGRPNNRGVLIGRVVKLSNGLASVRTSTTLSVGDVLEFWTKRGHFAYTIDELKTDAQGNVLLCPERPVGKGDRVFRVRSAADAFLEDGEQSRVAVCGRARLSLGQPIEVEFSLDPQAALAKKLPRALEILGKAQGPVAEPAKTRALSKEDVYTHIDRLGTTNFRLSSLDIRLDEGLGLSFSVLHRLRAAALDDLSKKLLEAWVQENSLTQEAPSSLSQELSNGLSQKAQPPFLQGAAPAFAECQEETQAQNEARPQDELRLQDGLQAQKKPQSKGGLKPVQAHSALIAALVTNPLCAQKALEAGADVVYVSALNLEVDSAQMAGVLLGKLEASYPKGSVVALPTIQHDAQKGTREYACNKAELWSLVKAGKAVYVDSLSALYRAASLGAQAEVGVHLPLVNRAALDCAARLGARRVWLSPELNLGQIEELAALSSLPLGITLIGSQELMVTEHCLLMSEGPCNQNCAQCARRMTSHALRDRKGFEFPLMSDALGRSHLYNGVQLDVVHLLSDLLKAGLDAFLVDTTLMDEDQAASAVARVAQARNLAAKGKSLAKLAGATTGHLFRGVS